MLELSQIRFKKNMSTTEQSFEPEGQTPSRPMLYWSWWLPLFGLAWLAFFFSAFPQPLTLFQQNWALIFVGIAGAFIGNITAVGGGLVFVPAMIFVYHLPPVVALKIAIATQSFGMTSGAIGWLRRGVVSLDALKFTIPGLLIGSTISSLVIHPNALLVKGLFGPVSILIGLITLFLHQRHRHNEKHSIPDSAKIPLFIVSLIGGLITGWVAIGEGEVIAAFLMLAYKINSSRSIGLGVVLLSINSIYLAIIHNFFLGGIPWNFAAFTILGAVYGARLGPYISQWINPQILKIGFAAIAIIDGTIFLLQFLLMGTH
jgi:uncharacterized membrane protein YfcA